MPLFRFPLRWVGAAFLLLLVSALAQADEQSFLAPTRDKGFLDAVIAKEKPAFAPPLGVTGISVPHHILAADLIARGFWAASANTYDRVILISPDHFRAVKGAFATTSENLQTVYGTIMTDQSAVDHLMTSEHFERLDTVAHEHGLMAIAPFIKDFFPDAQIVPVLAAIKTSPDDWALAAELLKPLVGPKTLIVQSTDYSHYRPLAEAIARDQETLATIATGDKQWVPGLMQPSHMDSKAAQFIQMTLQQDIFHATPVVVANRNSAEYGSNLSSTTSYIVTVYLKDATAASVLDYPDQTRLFFAGDVLLGRYLLPALREAKAANAMADAVLAQTGGAPMVINLEGVLLGEPVTGLNADAHVMNTELAAPMLVELHVEAASLANNHANDLGEDGYLESLRALRAIGIKPIEHGKLVDLGALRVVALNFLNGKFTGDKRVRGDDVSAICALDAAPPLIAFVHWGTEYTTQQTAEQEGIAEHLADCGVTLIVGAHSHQAAPSLARLAGGSSQVAWSLGNFLFDQSSPRGSGALLEVRVFEQGTMATRLVPIPNLFEVGQEELPKGP